MTEKCYWCGKNSTSREHVPPKCLFPENKDIGPIYDTSFRRLLVTVPSCDDHNLAKSHDDEYLMVCLGSRVGNNGIAYVHTNTKIRRAIERNPRLIQVYDETVINIGDRTFLVLLIHVDTHRLMRSLEAIARALVLHELNFRYEGRCWVISDMFVSSEDQRSTRFQLKSHALLSKEQTSWPTIIKGENPKIFTYQFSNLDGIGTFTITLTFYGKTVVYAIMSLLDDNTFLKAEHLLKPQVDRFLSDVN